jgi:phage-related protein
VSAGGHAVFKAIADFGQVRREARQTEHSLNSLDRAGNKTSGGFGKLVSGLGAGAGAVVGFTGKLAIAMPLIFGLASGLIAASGGTLALAGSLTAVAGLAVVIPGMLAGMAMAGLSVALAMKDVKTQLGGLLPDLQNLQKSVSGSFWAQAKGPITEMAHTLLPMFSDGLSQLGKSAGNMTADIANSLKKNLTGPVLKQMFDATAKGMENARKGIDPLIHAMTTLGTMGAKYLPALGKGFADLMIKFDAFISKADKDGSLKKWADGGIRVIKQLWSIVKSTVSILMSLFKAAQDAAPPDALEALAETMKKLAGLMKLPAVQDGLKNMFASAYQAMADFKQGLDLLGPALARLGPELAVGLEQSGKILGIIAGFIADIVSQPLFKQGLTDLFTKLTDAVVKLQPALKPLGDLLGTAASFLGDIAFAVGDILGTGIATLAPVFTELLKAVQPLIEPLKKFIKEALKELGPPLMTLAKDVLPQALPLIGKLLPILTELIKLALPVVTEYFKELAKGLKEINDNKEAATTLGTIRDILKDLNGLPAAFAALSFGDKETGLRGIMQFAIDHPEVTVFFDLLFKALKPGDNLAQLIIDVAAAFQNFGTVLGNLSGPGGPVLFIAFLAGLMTNLDLLFGKSAAWKAFWDGLPSPVSLAMALIIASLDINLPSMMQRFVGFFLSGTVSWGVFWDTVAVKTLVGIATIGTKIVLAGPQWAMGIAMSVALMALRFGQTWSLILGMIPGLVAAIGTALLTAFPGVREIVAGWPGQLAQNLLNGVGRLKSSGLSLVMGFAAGITSGTNLALQAALGVAAAVAGAFPNSPAKYGAFSGRGWTPYRGVALVEGFGEGMASRTGYLKKQAAKLVGAAQFDGQGSLSLEARLKNTMALPGGGPKGLGDVLSPVGTATAVTAQKAAAGPTTLIVNNPKPERATDSLPRVVRRLGYVGVGSNA